MKYLSLLCLVCLFTPVHAEIYKGVNAEGQTIYSDEKLPNTELIPTPTDNVIQMPKLIVIQAQKDDDDGDAYVYLNIDNPYMYPYTARSLYACRRLADYYQQYFAEVVFQDQLKHR